MKRTVALILILCALLSMWVMPSEAARVELQKMPFRDVSSSAWYYDDVHYAFSRKLVNGVSDTAFAPTAVTSRAMLVTILYRMSGSPEIAEPSGFKDVAKGTWYSDAIAWAVQEEVVNGVSKTEFRPNDTITREQLAAILFRYSRYRNRDVTVSGEIPDYPDRKKVSAWADEAMLWAIDRGLINGTLEKGKIYLQPQNGATRAVVSAIMHRLCVNILEMEKLRFAYIPLDNRPVNALRTKLQMEGADITIVMPEEHLYATRMDGQSKNPNGTAYGDREGLLAWLKEIEQDCDFFVISLDQMLSGGLVTSREMTHEELSIEYGIIDYLAELSERKPVYIFDTVIRLAVTTIGYLGRTQAEYNNFRVYGLQQRKELSGEDLTIENIVKGYMTDAEGELIETKIPSDRLECYHATRKRKLVLADYLLKKSENFKAVFLGVDDSYPNNSIQTNEIAYLRARMGENAHLFCGTDELGMMAISRAYADYCGEHAKLQVRYFGGQENEIVDMYDTGTLAESVKAHANALGMQIVQKDADAQVLVLSRATTQEPADELIEAWIENNEKKIPTIVIDTSGSNLTYEGILENMPVENLLGYSSWGTGGNTIGIALSMGQTRLAWLRNEPEKSEEAFLAWTKALTFALIKDIVYCPSAKYGIYSFKPAEIRKVVMKHVRTAPILEGLAGKQMLSDVSTYSECPEYTLIDFYAPFARTYEVGFTVIDVKDAPPEPEEPTELYQAVAEVLAFVYKLQGKI